MRLRGPDRPEIPVWCFGGTVPGPLLRVRRGEELRVRLRNALPRPIAVHWHGVRGHNALDGVAGLTQEPVAAGADSDIRLTPPDAGTFWYRAHALASTELAFGLHGLLIVDEHLPPAVDRDLALALSVWRPLTREATAEPGRAPLVSVNGAGSIEVPARTNERLRLRLVNAGAEIVALRIEQHAATVMAIDGEPAEPFRARSGRVRLAPGNRIDLFVDALLDPGASAPIVLETSGSERTIGRIAYLPGPPARPAPRAEPPPLPANPLPERMDFVRALKLAFTLERLTADKPDPPLFTVKRGRTVMLALKNGTPYTHAIHTHGHAFRLLDNLDDGWKPFWLDTVPIGPGETTRIAFVADNPGKWLLEAVALGQRERPPAAWFEVT